MLVSYTKLIVSKQVLLVIGKFQEFNSIFPSFSNDYASSGKVKVKRLFFVTFE